MHLVLPGQNLSVPIWCVSVCVFIYAPCVRVCFFSLSSSLLVRLFVFKQPVCSASRHPTGVDPAKRDRPLWRRSNSNQTSGKSVRFQKLLMSSARFCIIRRKKSAVLATGPFATFPFPTKGASAHTLCTELCVQANAECIVLSEHTVSVGVPTLA